MENKLIHGYTREEALKKIYPSNALKRDVSKQIAKALQRLELKHNQKKRINKIAAIVVVSESELKEQGININNISHKELISLLWHMGIDVLRPIEYHNVQHRNRFNNIVKCKRFIGHERTDDPWLASGYCSNEVIDKCFGGSLLEGMYRLKGQTEDLLHDLQKLEDEATNFDQVLMQIRKEYLEEGLIDQEYFEQKAKEHKLRYDAYEDA